MRFATRTEIEYLSSLDSQGDGDIKLIREMSRRLDALRRYDQCFCEADWRPRRSPDAQQSNGRSHDEQARIASPPRGNRHGPWHSKGEER
jgi:hypothetical protein